MEVLDDQSPDPGPSGFPELSALGKRIELLRVQRGISKQYLARHAGTSRQQLWRVMTGKSELTSSLRARLAEALGVNEGDLTREDVPLAAHGFPILPAAATADGAWTPSGATSLEGYVISAPLVERTLRTIPADPGGRVLMRAFLNAIEDVASERGIALPEALFALRRRVVNGDL